MGSTLSTRSLRTAPSGNGYWVVDDRGDVFAFNAAFHGSIVDVP